MLSMKELERWITSRYIDYFQVYQFTVGSCNLLTRDIKCTCWCPCTIGDSTLIRAVVGGVQLKLQLWLLLSVWHGHADYFAITEPADVYKACREWAYHRTPQGHHLIVPWTHIRVAWVQYGRIWGDNRIEFQFTYNVCWFILFSLQ